jgi:predicted metalloprotease
VIAHEVGHHVQNLLGVTGKVEQMQKRMSKRDANALSVQVELQADCFAGVWAAHASETGLLEPITEAQVSDALDAAAAVGDDRIQRQTQGEVEPDKWTHGSSRQRQTWFGTGLKSGDMRRCDTFGGSV